MWIHWKWPSNTRSVILKKQTNGNKTCSIFIRHSPWKMKGVHKFCTISLWSFWRQIENYLLVLKIGSCEHTTNDIPTFWTQKRNLEIGAYERLLPIFGTQNRIVWTGLVQPNKPQRRGSTRFCPEPITLSDHKNGTLKSERMNAYFQFSEPKIRSLKSDRVNGTCPTI